MQIDVADAPALSVVHVNRTIQAAEKPEPAAADFAVSGEGKGRRGSGGPWVCAGSGVGVPARWGVGLCSESIKIRGVKFVSTLRRRILAIRDNRRFSRSLEQNGRTRPPGVLRLHPTSGACH